MKKTLSYLALAGTSIILLSQRAFAALTDPPTVDGLSQDVDIKNTIVTILVYILDLVTILGVAFVIVAGIRLIISAGEEGEKDKAKKTIIYVIVGIIVVLLARVIVTFVNRAVG